MRKGLFENIQKRGCVCSNLMSGFIYKACAYYESTLDLVRFRRVPCGIEGKKDYERASILESQ